jgi:hypothetical protein
VLANAGHDVIWAGDWEKDPGDDEILAIAHREERVHTTGLEFASNRCDSVAALKDCVKRKLVQNVPKAFWNQA